MKTISQHLKQAFNALEFTNAGNLTTLNTMLAATDVHAAAASTEQHDAPTELDTGSVAAAN